MEPNWSELGVFITVCCSAVVGLVFAMQKSKCEHVSCCYGLVSCVRPRELIEANPNIFDQERP